MKILIAGGYGVVGGSIARNLRAAGHDVELLLGGRNPEQGEALAAELGNARATYLDVNNPVEDLMKMGSIDLIVAALKDTSDALFKASIELGVAHIGITKTADEISPLLFAACGNRTPQPIVLLGHWQAGVMAYVSAKVFEAFSQIDKVELAALYDPLDPIGPMTAGDSEDFFGRALIRQGNRWLWVDPNDNANVIHRPNQEPFDALPMGVLDVPCLGIVTGAPDIRFDLGIGQSIGSSADNAASHDMFITVSGELKSGVAATQRTLVTDPQGQAHLTSIGTLIAIERVLGLDGLPPIEGGLHSPVTVVSPDHAIARLEAFGVRISSIPADSMPIYAVDAHPETAS